MYVCMFSMRSKTVEPIRTKLHTSLQRPTEWVFAVKPSPTYLSFLQNEQTPLLSAADIFFFPNPDRWERKKRAADGTKRRRVLRMQ